MRFLRLGCLALSIVLGPLVFVGSSAGQAKIPGDFAFEKGKDTPGTVTFSHEKHRERAEKCTACHTKVFKMKKGTSGVLTMAAMKEGQFCGTCHNGKTEVGGKVGFSVDDKANCQRCHKPG